MGDLHPPPKAIALCNQPSNKVLAGPSASVEGSSLSTPYVSPASKRGDMADNPSHGTTWKEGSQSSLTTQGRSIKPSLLAARPLRDIVTTFVTHRCRPIL
ncbi:hypothetical protein BGW80DRAFT_1361417 [Lactifluus volemus]|nr:hypothetical protein BGW80DRAFT_1361417 [Lactifluus volemus]